MVGQKLCKITRPFHRYKDLGTSLFHKGPLGTKVFFEYMYLKNFWSKNVRSIWHFTTVWCSKMMVCNIRDLEMPESILNLCCHATFKRKIYYKSLAEKSTYRDQNSFLNICKRLRFCKALLKQTCLCFTSFITKNILYIIIE